MWRSNLQTPNNKLKVIYISDEHGRIFSFPIVKNKLSLRLLRLTFTGAVGLCYDDSPRASKKRGLVGKVTEVTLEGGKFKQPKDGWFYKNRLFYVRKDHHTKPGVFAVEMLRRYKALTNGVTLYIEKPKVDVGFKVVAAIDFGTSFSGYAYSFTDDILSIYTKQWSGAGMSRPTEKAPTTILLTPEGKFHAFGYEAEDEYSMLVDGEAFNTWQYFRNFKMTLYASKDLRRTTVLHDIDRKPMPAIEIFSMAIRHLKDQLLEDINCRDPDIDPKEIMWVITVPAIWSDAAKQFMREATVNATGIDHDSLKLVLEPEAASLFCKIQKPSDMEVISGTKTDNPMAPGQRYLLLDIGGGTADMAAHEVLEGGSLKEIHKATGDALGGSNIDDAFSKIICELFGPDVMLTFFQDYRQDYIEFMREFEAIKRLPFQTSGNVVFKLPGTLREVMYNRNKSTPEEAVQKSKYASKITVNGDKLMFDGEIMLSLYKPTVQGIVKYVRHMKMNEKTEDISTIILVGGFSKCEYVRAALQTEYPNDLIIAPTDPGLAILKGAVLMGHRPETIVERVAKYTYGVSYARSPFVEGEDPEKLKARRNGTTYCDDMFEKLVQIGQPIKFNDVFTVTRTSHLENKESKNRNLYTKVYASVDENPRYCTLDCDCVKIGEIVRTPPEGGWPDVMKSQIDIKFGETEMIVTITEESTNVRYRARLDAL